MGHPGFGLKTGTIGGFERSVNEYDCITLALITALHRVYDLQLESRCDMASIYEEYDGFQILEALLCMKCPFLAKFSQGFQNLQSLDSFIFRCTTSTFLCSNNFSAPLRYVYTPRSVREGNIMCLWLEQLGPFGCYRDTSCRDSFCQHLALINIATSLSWSWW